MNKNRTLGHSVESLRMAELNLLETYLKDKNIPYKRRDIFDGEQILVFDAVGNNLWDAIIHSGSYGHKLGLLEIRGTIVNREMDGDTVVGNLTAQDIIERIERQ